jgi:hypothetical protein
MARKSRPESLVASCLCLSCGVGCPAYGPGGKKPGSDVKPDISSLLAAPQDPSAPPGMAPPRLPLLRPAGVQADGGVFPWGLLCVLFRRWRASGESEQRPWMGLLQVSQPLPVTSMRCCTPYVPSARGGEGSEVREEREWRH